MNLHGHTVLITGGATGIGLALAEGFLRRGNVVFICGRRTEKLEAARTRNSELRAIQCDVTKDEDVQRLLGQIRDAGAPISILVNNAGAGLPYSLVHDSQAWEKVEREVVTNLLAPVRLTTLLLPCLLKQPNPAILNVTSGFALWPWFIAPGYSMSKAGLRSFTLSLRAHLSKTRVKVFEALPPLVDTELARDIPGKRHTAEQIAEKILAAMAKDRFEIVMGVCRAIQFFSRFSPAILQRALLRYPVSFETMERHYRDREPPSPAS